MFKELLDMKFSPIDTDYNGYSFQYKHHYKFPFDTKQL